MRNEGPSPFTPPPTSGLPTVLIVVALFASLGLTVYAGVRFEVSWLQPVAQWLQGENKVETSLMPDAMASMPPSKLLPSQRAESQRVPVPIPEAAPAWVRCETQGQVTYSNTGCAGATEKRRSSTSQAALSVVQPDAGAPGTHTIFRCKAYSGGVFWSSRHCNQKQALVDRIVTVPQGLTFQQQIKVAEQSLPRTPSATAPGAPAHSTSASGADRKKNECASLDKTVHNLDAQARQPQSGAEQDRLRREKQSARSRQFVLRC